jgi:hypothetical protein
MVGGGPSVDIWEAANTGNIEAVKQHNTTGTNVEPKRSAPKVPPVAKVDVRSLFTAADLVVVAKAPMGGAYEQSHSVRLVSQGGEDAQG